MRKSKAKKRIVSAALALSAFFALPLSACGKKDDENRKYFINRTTWVLSRAGQRGVSPANDLVVGPRRASVGAELESCNSDDRCPRQKTGRSCWGSGQQDASAAQGTKHPLGAATRTRVRREIYLLARPRGYSSQR